MIFPGAGLLIQGKYLAGIINFIVYLIAWAFFINFFRIGITVLFIILVHSFSGWVSYVFVQQCLEQNNNILSPDLPNEKIKFRTVLDFFSPFKSVFFNAIFPGAGFWFLGKWKAGLKNMAYLLIIFLILTLLKDHINTLKMVNAMQFIDAYGNITSEYIRPFAVYIPIIVSSACLVFPVARRHDNKNRTISLAVTKIHDQLQYIIAPVTNLFVPGSGFFLIGDYKAGVTNLKVYFSIIIAAVFFYSTIYYLPLKNTLNMLNNISFAIQIITTFFLINNIRLKSKAKR